MDWEALAKNFGMPGLMLGAMIYGWRLWVASNERVQLEKVKVEDKKAEAMAGALTSLSGKIDLHHTTDIQSHQEMAEGIAELHGKLDQAITDRTPVRGVPTVEPTGGYYPPARPKTGGR
jgi:hypothetical protein